jgi:hypothetical protein
MADNPLASRKSAQPQRHPAMQHAVMWQHMNNVPPEDVADRVDRIDLVLPMIAKLASNPKTTRKDVIKAAADLSSSGKVPASELVSAISSMPLEQTKLHDWLQKLYALSMSAAVHIKAVNMRQGGAA